MSSLNPSYHIMPRLRRAVLHDKTPSTMPIFQFSHAYYYSIILVTAGAARFTCNNESFDVSAGDVVVCKQTACCALIPQESGFTYILLCFDSISHDCVADILPFACALRLAEPEQTMTLLRVMVADGQLEAVQSHLLSAILLQVRAAPALAPCDTIVSESMAYQMSAFIHQRYTDDIFLNDICRAVGVSASHAIHMFKPVYGASPMQYLNMRRIGQAQLLLLTTGLAASQIAPMVGITNINYFYTAFKKLVGMSPTSFRNYFHDKVHVYIPDEPAYDV